LVFVVSTGFPDNKAFTASSTKRCVALSPLRALSSIAPMYATLNSLPDFATLKQGVVTIPKSSSIPDALKTLIDHKITSVPVVEDNDPNKAIGLVSILDILNHFLNNFEAENIRREVKHTYDFFSLIISKKHVNQEKASEIKELGELDPIFTVHEKNATFMDVAKTMTNHGSHRVLVVDEQGKLKNLITQSRAVQLLPFVMDALPMFKKSIKDLNIGFKEVYTVNEDDMSIAAFQKMRDKKISAVGVINDKGVLIGNISATDIKGLGYDLTFFGLLGVSVKEYLKNVSSTDLRSHEMRHNHINIIHVRETDKLETAVKLANYYRVHRVYVTNDEGKPVGLLALRDILQAALQEQS